MRHARRAPVSRLSTAAVISLRRHQSAEPRYPVPPPMFPYAAPSSPPPSASRQAPLSSAPYGSAAPEGAAAPRRPAYTSSVGAVFEEAFPNTPRSRAVRQSSQSRADNLAAVRALFPASLTKAVSTGSTVADRIAFTHGHQKRTKPRHSGNGRAASGAWLGLRESFHTVAATAFPGVPAASLASLTESARARGVNGHASSSSRAPAPQHMTGHEGAASREEKEALARLTPQEREDLERYHAAYDEWREKNQQILQDRAQLHDLQRELQSLQSRQRAMAKEVLQDVLSWTWYVMLPLMTVLLLTVMIDARSYSRQVEEISYVNYDKLLEDMKRARRQKSEALAKQEKAKELLGKLTSPMGQQKKKKGGGGGDGGASGPPPSQHDIKID